MHRIGRGERETRDGGGGLGLMLFRPTLLMLILTGAEAKRRLQNTAVYMQLAPWF